MHLRNERFFPFFGHRGPDVIKRVFEGIKNLRNLRVFVVVNRGAAGAAATFKPSLGPPVPPVSNVRAFPGPQRRRSDGTDSRRYVWWFP